MSVTPESLTLETLESRAILPSFHASIRNIHASIAVLVYRCTVYIASHRTDDGARCHSVTMRGSARVRKRDAVGFFHSACNGVCLDRCSRRPKKEQVRYGLRVSSSSQLRTSTAKLTTHFLKSQANLQASFILQNVMANASALLDGATSLCSKSAQPQ